MGTGSQTSRQETTTSLPANQQTNIDQLMQGALDYYRNGGRTYYPGETVAGFDPYQTQGQNTILDYASGTGQQLVDQTLASNAFFTDPNNIMNPENIPGFTDSIDAMTRKYTDNLNQNILPYVRGGGTASGQFGGSASGIGQGLAVGESNQALADSTANMYLGAYESGLDSFNQAMTRAPGMFALGAQPGSIVEGVGGVRQAQDQRQIDADVARHNFAQNEPAVMLSLLQALSGTGGEYGGTTETKGKVEGGGGGGILPGIGGLLTIASMFGGEGGLSGLFGGGNKGGESSGEGLGGSWDAPPWMRPG